MADDDGIPSHRPLPSVDIPLLRDERRALRARTTVGFVAGLLVATAVLAAVLVVPRYLSQPASGRAPNGPAVPATLGAPATTPNTGASPAREPGGPPRPQPATPSVAASAAPSPSASPSAEPVATANQARAAAVQPTQAPAGGSLPQAAPRLGQATVATRTTRPFGTAVSFRDALVAAGASRDEAQALITALEQVVDFRRCRPEDQLTFERNAQNELVRFEYRASVTQVYEARRDGPNHYHGARVEVPVERTRLARGGHVSTSLGDALDALHLGRALVGTFVEVFEGHIQFTSATRGGDHFRIIVDEERVDGQLLRYGTIHALEYAGDRAGTHRAYWYETEPGFGDFYDETGRAMHGGWLRTPLHYEHISSPFDLRRMHPVLHRVMPHTGIDYAAPAGTPVWAAADGTVTWIGDRGPNGNLVTVRHEGGFESHYAHLSRYAAGLRVGMRVRQRQLVGYVGSTGRSTGPHLHFGLKKHGRFVDPMHELNGPGRMLPTGRIHDFRRRAQRLAAELDRIPLAPAPSGSTATRAPEPTEDFGEDDSESGAQAPAPSRPATPRAPRPATHH